MCVGPSKLLVYSGEGEKATLVDYIMFILTSSMSSCPWLCLLLMSVPQGHAPMQGLEELTWPQMSPSFRYLKPFKSILIEIYNLMTKYPTIVFFATHKLMIFLLWRLITE